MDDLTKMIVIPFDGSKNALRSLDYLNLIYGPKYNLRVTLFYILPYLPSIISDDGTIDNHSWSQITATEKKNVQIAERILSEARATLIEMGFEEERIQTLNRKKVKDIALDTCRWAQNNKADAK